MTELQRRQSAAAIDGIKSKIKKKAVEMNLI
jgi:hypothetical protein